MNKYEDMLVEWFTDKVELPSDYLDKNYFNEGWIDSFDIVELIADLEEEFDFSFTQEHFQDRRFSSINGLVTIIEEIKG